MQDGLVDWGWGVIVNFSKKAAEGGPASFGSVEYDGVGARYGSNDGENAGNFHSEGFPRLFSRSTGRIRIPSDKKMRLVSTDRTNPPGPRAAQSLPR